MVGLLLEHWDIIVAFAGVAFCFWLLYFSPWKNVGID